MGALTVAMLAMCTNILLLFRVRIVSNITSNCNLRTAKRKQILNCYLLPVREQYPDHLQWRTCIGQIQTWLYYPQDQCNICSCMDHPKVPDFLADTSQLASGTSLHYQVWMEAHLPPMRVPICGVRVVKFWELNYFKALPRINKSLAFQGFEQVVKSNSGATLNWGSCRFVSHSLWSPWRPPSGMAAPDGFLKHLSK